MAIAATKRDMESNKIMDRLICGDVGYGKTEVAIRAAFKAVQDGKQVVFLVPTTILAQQHYNTFVQRMKDYPIRIEQMSRFRTPAQQKKVIEDLKKGLVDIVIGMILLFILLCVHILKVDHTREKSDFLLENMAFFFIPAGVSIINYFDVLKNWVVQLIVICVVSTVVTFAVTAYSMKLPLYLMQKKKSGRAKE